MAVLLKLLKNPAKIVLLLDKAGLSKLIPDRQYLKIKYRASIGKKLDLKNPKTYNEKIQWLKLYDRDPAYTKLVDKYEVKSYVAEKIGDEYIIPTLGVWDNVEDIDFDALPNRFVLKCTHDCGGLVICKDKAELDIAKAKRKLQESLKNNFYYEGREWPYKNVKPRILAEAYMEDTETAELRDYKFFCFDGEPKFVMISTDRQKENEKAKYDYYDMNFNHLDCRRGCANSEKPKEKPQTFEKMQKLAEILSKGFSHIRIDLYEVDGKNYFGEMTFYPGNGMVLFEPDEWNYTFGSWIKLPKK